MQGGSQVELNRFPPVKEAWGVPFSSLGGLPAVSWKLGRNFPSITLDPLHSVLSIPLDVRFPIWLLHPSIRDFLLDHDRRPDDQF